MLNSRKFRFGLICLLLIFAVGASVLINPIFLHIIEILVGGIVAVFGIYCGVNVANKYALGKAQGATVYTSQLIKEETSTDTLPTMKINLLNRQEDESGE